MTVEQIFKEYPVWVRRKKALGSQIENFKDFSESDIIKDLNFFKPLGEKVRTSGISDKTAKIALNYKKIVSSESGAYYYYLVSEYWKLCENINFFDAAIASLSGYLPEFIKDMVINEFTWDTLSKKYNINRSTIGRYKKKAIRELTKIYKTAEVTHTVQVLKRD